MVKKPEFDEEEDFLPKSLYKNSKKIKCSNDAKRFKKLSRIKLFPPHCIKKLK